MQLFRLLNLPSRGTRARDCRCGHAEGAHEHYRRGSDCGLCRCPKFKAGAAAQSRGTRDDRSEQARAA